MGKLDVVTLTNTISIRLPQLKIIYNLRARPTSVITDDSFYTLNMDGTLHHCQPESQQNYNLFNMIFTTNGYLHPEASCFCMEKLGMKWSTIP